MARTTPSKTPSVEEGREGGGGVKGGKNPQRATWFVDPALEPRGTVLIGETAFVPK
jgi:hypothetical protein